MAQSEFEKSAQRQAVEAVERRWQQQRDAERHQRRRKMFGNLLAIVVLMAGLVGLGSFAARQWGDKAPFLRHLDIRRWMSGSKAAKVPSAAEVGRRDEYARRLRSFRGKRCVLWREAPAAVKPKSAAAGRRYLALVNDRGDRRLYELVSDGCGSVSVSALSPLAEPVRLEPKEFGSCVAGRPFLLLCDDVVYAVGCKDKADMDELVGTLPE